MRHETVPQPSFATSVSNTATVIVTIGALFLGMCAMTAHLSASGSGEPLIFAALGALTGFAFVGSLVGYVVGHRRGDDEAYTTIVGALAAGFGVPVLIAVVVILLKLLGF